MEAAIEIAGRSRGTPRIANALLRRVRDFAQIKGNGKIDIEIARFANPAGLQAIGGNMLVETQASGAPQVGGAGEEGRGNLRGGMLEGSNVNVVEELVDMIETQRAYEVNSKMISATDEMMKNASQTL